MWAAAKVTTEQYSLNRSRSFAPPQSVLGNAASLLFILYVSRDAEVSDFLFTLLHAIPDILPPEGRLFWLDSVHARRSLVEGARIQKGKAPLIPTRKMTGNGAFWSRERERHQSARKSLSIRGNSTYCMPPSYNGIDERKQHCCYLGNWAHSRIDPCHI